MIGCYPVQCSQTVALRDALTRVPRFSTLRLIVIAFPAIGQPL